MTHNALAFDSLTAAERGTAISPTDLTPDQVLLGVKRYYADLAADAWENDWRQRLSTLNGVPPLAAALVAAEWLIKGPEALKVLAGGTSDFIETEAQIITLFSPSTPKTAAEVAAEVASRFEFWTTGGAILTALRRAAQHRIWAQTTPDGCAGAFSFMRQVADDLIGLTLSGATRGAVMARMAELARGMA